MKNSQMATLPNPAQQLAAVVSQLYELSGDSRIPTAQQQALLLQAHDLRGDLVTLVSLQFTQNTVAYKGVMSNLDSVSDTLQQAQEGITQALAVINGVAQLAKSIDNLLTEAAQTGAIV